MLVLQQHVVGGNMEQGEGVEVAVVRLDRPANSGRPQARQKTFMCQDRALGPARGARGIQDPGRVAGAGCRQRGLSLAGEPGGIFISQAQAAQSVGVVRVLPQRPQQGLITDKQADLRRAQLIGQFRRRQPGVERHQDMARR